ncbi:MULTISPECIES: tetratricopeptide repeat protein [unclassified Epibacterium]|jgi:tetratricopeptide (TPR) repeat protein|uniref:tetratricopeptide repeat protein n=1 Tax=unclassified Epibacterium TaxID=2639179 RepID=UPI001EF56E48|nr:MULTISPECIES: tetratricopeptide repeat protein [unclassified Epibacterium]MCG7625650.1 tetratricopeptide repeat protein [Epibacterium sp. Ofav1-8]MCG7628025.1 tetratricopeptide repeat protein [Epibacterium sp. MM17-32]
MTTRTRRTRLFRLIPPATVTCALALVAACVSAPARNSLSLTDDQGVWAPGVNPTKDAVNGLDVGHRLMAAGQYELAIDAFNRAALNEGLTPEVLSSLGTANLGLGRLGQAEDLLRRAVRDAPEWPEALNNLGVVLMEQGKHAEAEQILRRAYALDNGESDAIRDNLRLALENLDNPGHTAATGEEFKLVRRGGGVYRIQTTP